MLEARQTPDAGVGALYGTVYFDASGLGSFAGSVTPAPGATVQLFRDGSAAPLAAAVTDAQGRYAFTGLEPGSYTLVEVPPAGQTFATSRLTSQVYNASGAGTNAVHVTVADPSSVWVNYGGVVPGEFLSMNVLVNGTPLQNAVGTLAATLGTAPGKTDLNAGFQTYCLDDLADLSFSGGEQFRVKPRAITDLTDGTGGAVPAGRAGRIADLYNTYSQAKLSDVDSAGLQLALWELMYDAGPTPDFSQGNFRVVSAVSPADQALVDQAVSRAVVLFNLSAGHDGGALLLDATAFNQAVPAVGFQSMIATEQFDFLNVPKPTPAPASLSGSVFCDRNRDGRQQPGEIGLPGVLVILTGKDASGKSVVLATRTSTQPANAGSYCFDNLAPGTYTITEGATPGYTHVGQTQGTPGNGNTSVPRQIRGISLAAGVHGVDNDFGEIKPAVGVVGAALNGIHMQQTTITLTLSGDPDPALVTNPSYYTLTALGSDDRLGTADDRRVAVSSVTYDPATRRATLVPAEHLNIHHYYLLVARFPGDACTPASTAVRVLGRSDVPVFLVHGKPQAPPALTAQQAARSLAVRSRTLALASARGYR